MFCLLLVNFVFLLGFYFLISLLSRLTPRLCDMNTRDWRIALFSVLFAWGPWFGSLVVRQRYLAASIQDMEHYNSLRSLSLIPLFSSFICLDAQFQTQEEKGLGGFSIELEVPEEMRISFIMNILYHHGQGTMHIW